MKKIDEKEFWVKIQAAFKDGKSIKVKEEERKAAEKFVDAEKCFWSIDMEHVMAYEAD